MMKADKRLKNWNNFKQARDYCSLPKWLPKKFISWYEANYWKACKVHDSDCGKLTTVDKKTADEYFLYNLINRCGCNKILAYISFFFVRIFGNYNKNNEVK